MKCEYMQDIFSSSRGRGIARRFPYRCASHSEAVLQLRVRSSACAVNAFGQAVISSEVYKFSVSLLFLIIGALFSAGRSVSCVAPSLPYFHVFNMHRASCDYNHGYSQFSRALLIPGSVEFRMPRTASARMPNPLHCLSIGVFREDCLHSSEVSFLVFSIG